MDGKIYLFGGYDGRTRSNELFILEEGAFQEIYLISADLFPSSHGHYFSFICASPNPSWHRPIPPTTVMPTLVDLCVVAISKNLDKVGNLGRLPLELREMVENPAQYRVYDPDNILSWEE